LAGELTAVLAEMRQRGATIYDREAALVLRAIEDGARNTGPAGKTEYLELMARLLHVVRTGPATTPASDAGRPGSSLILP
jgi:hypothetical protein